MPAQDDKYRSYTSGNFDFRLDGEPTGIYLKSVEGGFVKGQVVDGTPGANLLPIRHIATPSIDPIALEFGLSSSRGLMDWISQSWANNFARHDGQITHANARYNESFQHNFYRALITETTFPALDGGSKEPGYIKVKLQPEEVQTTKIDNGPKMKSSDSAIQSQKMWLPSMFRFTLDGINGMEYTNKLESFTITQTVKPVYIGTRRFPEYEPVKVNFPGLSGSISLTRADDLLAWHDKYVVRGYEDVNSQITGAIELLTPDLKSTILTIDLEEVGISAIQIPRSEANSDQIKRVKFDLFVGKMTLKLGSDSDYDDDD